MLLFWPKLRSELPNATIQWRELTYLLLCGIHFFVCCREHKSRAWKSDGKTQILYICWLYDYLIDRAYFGEWHLINIHHFIVLFKQITWIDIRRSCNDHEIIYDVNIFVNVFLLWWEFLRCGFIYGIILPNRWLDLCSYLGVTYKIII